MMKKNVVTLGLILLCMIKGCQRSHSHALDPESIDRYANLTMTQTHLMILYEVILGLKPTEKAAQQLDANDDGKISEEERDAFIQQRAKQYAENQTIQLGDFTLEPRFKVGDAYSFIGHNGINVIKIDLGYLCSLPDTLPIGEPLSFVYKDDNFPRVGWKQVKFQTSSGVTFNGNIPYEDYEPFDYEKMVDLQYPVTDRIELSVTFPESGSTSFSSGNASNEVELQLPERVVEPEGWDWLQGIILGAVILFIAVFVVVLVIRMRG